MPPAQQRKRESGTFKDYDLGFVHIDIKHLPKLRTANGERRKRFLYVAIDRHRIRQLGHAHGMGTHSFMTCDPGNKIAAMQQERSRLGTHAYKA